MGKDLKLLIQVWLSEELHEDTDRLVQRLIDEEEFRLAFVDEVLMMGKVKAINLSEPKFSLLEEILSDQPQSSVEYEDKIFQSLEKEDRNKKVIKYVLAIAAVLTFIIVLNLPKTGKVPLLVKEGLEESEVLTPTFAIISSQSNTKWANEKYESQKKLHKDELELLEGTARIDFIFGASLVIKGGTKISIQEIDQLFLHKGQLTCEVNEFGRGFKINTKESEIIDLGTAFQVEAGDGKETKVHVIDGEVKVRPNNVQESKSFYKSESVAVTLDKLESIAYSVDRIETIGDYEEALEKRRQEKYEKWLLKNKEVDSNPDTVFHLVKSDKSLIQLHKDVSGTEVQAVYNFGSGNERGRWFENGAISYSKEYDRTLVRLKNEHKQFTLMTWVKFDNLKSSHSALMCFEMPQRWLRSIGKENIKKIGKTSMGSFHAMRWVVGRDGRLSLGLGYYGENKTAQALVWHRFHSNPRTVNRKAIGNWLCLAVTVDSKNKKVSHFFNGRRVAHLDMTQALSANMEFLEIGNLTVPELSKNSKLSFRLNGSIDEMLIHGEALAPKEIREIYINGRP